MELWRVFEIVTEAEVARWSIAFSRAGVLVFRFGFWWGKLENGDERVLNVSYTCMGFRLPFILPESPFVHLSPFPTSSGQVLGWRHTSSGVFCTRRFFWLVNFGRLHRVWHDWTL